MISLSDAWAWCTGKERILALVVLVKMINWLVTVRQTG